MSDKGQINAAGVLPFDDAEQAFFVVVVLHDQLILHQIDDEIAGLVELDVFRIDTFCLDSFLRPDG